MHEAAAPRSWAIPCELGTTLAPVGQRPRDPDRCKFQPGETGGEFASFSCRSYVVPIKVQLEKNMVISNHEECRGSFDDE